MGKAAGIALQLRLLLAMAKGPGSSPDLEARLERLYRDQAAGFDAFRDRFLHGRRDLLALLDPAPGSTVVELGAGTGRNLEFLGARLAGLGRVYLVDLCPSLLAVARERAARLGWTNVTVVEGDAAAWRPPDGKPVDAAWFSYSLSMIPDWFRAVDNAMAMVRPGGILGVVDFHLARKHPGPGRIRQGALYRAFWRTWLARDDVFPSPDLVPFLEDRLEGVRLSEHRGPVPWLPFMRIPYFILVGRKRQGPGGREPKGPRS